MGIVGDNQHQLVALLKQAQRPLLVDARVFNLVNEDDRAVTDQGDIRNHQRTGLAAAELVQPLPESHRFWGDFIGKGQNFCRGCPPVTAAGVELKKLLHTDIQHKAHILAQMGHQMGGCALPLCQWDRHSVQQDPAACDGVSAGQLLDVLDEPGLSGAGVANNGV